MKGGVTAGGRRRRPRVVLSALRTRSGARRHRAWAAALATACLATVLVVDPVPTASADTGPVRILVLGDSVTQGSAGDWTWRYRLWQHLTGAGVAFDLVGPRTDLLDRTTNSYGSHGYLDPDFDQDHAAQWGNALGWPAFSVSRLVADYQPDVVVELLGINDLYGLGSSVDTVDDELRTLVADARAQKPDVDVVLGALGSDWIPNVPEFNAQLPALAASLDTPTSRVVASAPPHLVEDVDTYEFVHPSATGEGKIAAAIDDALSSLGIGPPAERPLPTVSNGPRDPARLTAVPGDTSVSLSWSLPLGADRVYVEQRDLDATDPGWHRQTDPVVLPARGTDLVGLVPGDRYEVRVRAAKGTAVAEDIVSSAVAFRPGVPGPLTYLGVFARRHGFHATWSEAALATSYHVRWWPLGHRSRARSRTTPERDLWVRHLRSGRRYVVAVRGQHDPFLGQPSRQVVVPGLP